MKNTEGDPIIILPDRVAGMVAGQCDACSPIIFTGTPLPPSDFGDHARFFLRNEDLIRFSIEDDHSAFLVPSNQPFMVLNAKAVEILNNFRSPKSLPDLHRTWGGEESLASLLSDFLLAGLIRAEENPKPQFMESSRQLAAWLHLTDRCNLHCAYCYLPHKNVDVTEAVGKAAIDAVFRSAEIHDYRTVKLKYAGGEPLLRLDLIEVLHRYAQVRAAERQIQLDGVILSNGTLLSQDIVRVIQALDLRIMISLDGIALSHNIQRPFANGGSSFQVVAEGIELLLDNGIIPDISVTVSSRNSDGLCDLTAWLLERNLPFSFNLYRESDLSRDKEGLRLDDARIIAGLKAAYGVIENHLPDRTLLAGLLNQTNLAGPHLYPCSVGRSYLVFDPQGRVSKCQMQIDRPVASVKDNDPLSLVRRDCGGIQNLSVDDKSECRECRWKYWCAGGCPLASRRSSGSFAGKSPNCAIYKALLPEIMRLEGLRLLKEYRASF